MPKSPAPPPSAFEYAMKILSKRSYSEFEVRNKLKKKNYPASDIQNAVEECKRYSFINDELYAADYANLLNARGCGALLIRKKLSLLHIDKEFIGKALEAIGENELQAAENAFDFKLRMLKNEKNPFKKRQKLTAFMLSRGYTFDIIRTLIDKTDFTTEKNEDE